MWHTETAPPVCAFQPQLSSLNPKPKTRLKWKTLNIRHTTTASEVPSIDSGFYIIVVVSSCYWLWQMDDTVLLTDVSSSRLESALSLPVCSLSPLDLSPQYLHAAISDETHNTTWRIFTSVDGNTFLISICTWEACVVTSLPAHGQAAINLQNFISCICISDYVSQQ